MALTGTIHVLAGEVTILKTSSKDAADAFLYGLGLAYSVIPPTAFERLREEVKREVE
jgi:hypothetical protein